MTMTESPSQSLLTGRRLLTADDLAARWQVDKTHVYRLARDGCLPIVKLGRYTRFRLDAIEEYEQVGGGCQSVDMHRKAA